MSVIQVVSVYNDLSSLGRARATLHFLCREKEDGAGGEKNLKKLMERDRQRRRDHMEFHSFRFLSQMLFLKLTHVVFITPDSSKQLVCGAESLDLCLLRARACTSVRASSHVWCRAFHTCVRLCVCVCVSNLNAFHHSVYGPCSVRSVCKMPMLHTQQPCPIEIDWSHGGRVILGVYAVLL